jgi:hypothetical protein
LPLIKEKHNFLAFLKIDIKLGCISQNVCRSRGLYIGKKILLPRRILVDVIWGENVEKRMRNRRKSQKKMKKED